MRLLHLIDALRSALIDPARRERSVLLALAAYTLLWALYGTITKSSQGLSPDMTELVAWSRDLSFGYFKHPPLAAWLVRAWFSLLPVAEWSYYLLAMLMPALTLWIVWQGSAEYLDVEKRLAGLALLTLVPFFNFHALKYNVNTVLMPVWAVTSFWFLRSYRTRSTLYAALAGIGAAACMLGKYWSVFLIAGLIVAALVDRRRLDYMRAPAPYATLLPAAPALAPHVVWLVHPPGRAGVVAACRLAGPQPLRAVRLRRGRPRHQAACRDGGWRDRLSHRVVRGCGGASDHRAGCCAAGCGDHR